MANIKSTARKPFVQRDATVLGDLTAIVRISGAAQESISLTFSETSIKAIVTGLLGIPVYILNDEARDAAGELANMLCEDASRRHGEKSISLHAGIPTVILGKAHKITHIAKGPCIAIPFETSHGAFIVEVA